MTPSHNPYRVITCWDDHDLLLREQKRIGGEWPEFMLHDPVAQKLAECYQKLPDFQFVLIDQHADKVVSIANSIPLSWDDKLENLPDTGWDWALAKGIEDADAARKPNLLCALQIVVFDGNRGKGISAEAVRAMKAIGQSHGLRGLIAPVRPNRKCEFQDTSIDEYITWTNDDGLPFDPWLRVHIKEGARIIKPCHTAMRIPGSVADWEKWTGMRFKSSGDYPVPGALVPVRIDLEKNEGVYVEPNVWVWHDLS